ncbi:MAG: bifunctional UDP-N-acetylglucosamine diphosphorylase/glucosamine-1-phosphate N-acetyltransferase GlmU [Rhodospirillaceae bacterium]
MSSDLAVVILAAGKGTRMKSALPKVLHPIAGRPMVAAVAATAAALQASRMVGVIGPEPEMASVAAALAPHPCVIQADRLGTGHAVQQARSELEANPPQTVLILYGDTPLIPTEVLAKMITARKDAAVVVLGFRPDDPGAYGRLITAADGSLEAIVEAKDATPAQLAVPLCNSGVMAVDGALLFPLLDKVGNDNAKGEYYLTDLVALARAAGQRCAVVEGAEADMMGVNSRVDLAAAEAVAQARLRRIAMEGGATLTAPDTVFFSYDTRLGQDVVVGPFTTFGPGVTVEDGVTIKGYCHFEDCHVSSGVILGPYARLRPGAEIGPDAHIGNFVEIKKATVEAGAKINHLSYVGDARVGAKANVGAGTICCNYDGYNKSHTDIGAGAFIGSNSALVAPVTIGDGAIIGAGSAVSGTIPADSLALTRAPLEQREGWAAKFREMQRRAKAALKGTGSSKV